MITRPEPHSFLTYKITNFRFEVVIVSQGLKLVNINQVESGTLLNVFHFPFGFWVLVLLVVRTLRSLAEEQLYFFQGGHCLLLSQETSPRWNDTHKVRVMNEDTYQTLQNYLRWLV